MYQALYRKWRPRTFADVIGQSHITATLQKQVAEGRISHAYLFTGTRGTGKTTCAKILAKAVNCEHPEDGNPCNACPSCLGIESGGFLDVLELDAASNNGVDQVRALRDEAIYAPANVKFRVYIIDEVHMLSVPAFNALLKILEEPPAHLIFILATTELHKVPATILSRCQRFSFKRITPQDIAARLTYVAERESIDLRPDGAELLSRLADGALRDGLSLLDQCAAAGGAIDAAAVLDVLGLAGNLQTAQLMDCVSRRDAKAALLLLSRLYAGGKDVGAILAELSTLTRDLLLRRIAPEGGAALLSGGYDMAALDRLDQTLSTERLLSMATLLQQATSDLSYSANRRTDAELCLLQLCDESLCGNVTALAARIQHLEERVAALPMTIRTQAAQPIAAPPAPPVSAAQASPASRNEPPPWDEPPLPEEPPVPEESPPAAPVFSAPQPAPAGEGAAPSGAAIPASAPTDSAAPADGSAPADAVLWQQLSEACKGGLPAMYRVFLDKCSGALEGDLLSVTAPDEMTRGRLDNDRVLASLRENAQALTGAAVRVQLRVGAPRQATAEDRRRNLIDFGSKFDNIQIK